MEWLDSWYFVAAVLWLVGSVFAVTLVAVNPPDRYELLIQDLDLHRTRLPGPVRRMRRGRSSAAEPALQLAAGGQRP
ncbi:MAG TPA: hypothetical protein VM491_20085 [Burkholderiaceae bacterium]|nr:hypothetical protein [Burkholderiaceae bacterium]